MDQLTKSQTEGNVQYKKIEELVNLRFNQLEAKMDQFTKSQPEGNVQRSPSQINKRPLKPSKPLLSGLRCHLREAPSRVKNIQTQFNNQLKQKLTSEKLQIKEDPSGPTIVFSVNSSRLISDIQRDMRAEVSG